MKSASDAEEELLSPRRRERTTSHAASHRNPDATNFPPRQRSTGSIVVPKTLSARASLIVASNPRSLLTPPSSPRLRTVSVDSNKRNMPPLPDFVKTPILRSSEEEEEEEEESVDEEYDALAAKKQFITEKMKEKNKPLQRMSVGNINFIDCALSDFCVTEASTPYSTPPPERNMSSDVSFREVASLKSDIRKLRDEIAHMHKQQQEMNNFYYRLRCEKEAQEMENNNQCFLFSWL